MDGAAPRDDSAYRGGQVSLDPTPHIRREPLGMVLVPLASYLFGGWMIGWASTPYSPEWAARYPRRAAWMALAGPAANLLLVLAAAWLMRMGLEWGVFHQPGRSGLLHLVAAAGAQDGAWAFCAKMVSLLFGLNLLLGAFNLLPVPPLDGSSIPLLFLSSETAEKYGSALRQPMLSFLGLMLAWKLFGAAFPLLFQAAARLLAFAMPAR